MHGNEGVRAPLRVEGLYTTLFAEKHAACSALIDRKAVKPKVVRQVYSFFLL